MRFWVTSRSDRPPRRGRGHLQAALFGALSLVASLTAAAPAAPFDHYTTGYELIGLHHEAECATCHVGGIFKGTPHECDACHSAGSRFSATAKPTTHILSSRDCSQCHTPAGWSPVATFNHMNVMGTCSSCHNGTQTSGKPPNHIPTTAECSSCHLVSLPWSAATFTHTGITGNCASCHDNVHAPGQPSGHLPTSAPCETCHSSNNFTTFAGTPMAHTGIVNNCQACHETGMNWYGVTMVDRPTSTQDPKHPLSSAVGGADCANCHQGFNVGDFAKDQMPANHIPYATTAACGDCHKTSDYTARVTMTDTHAHAQSTTVNCSQCHGSAAPSFAIPASGFSIVGMPSGHLPTTASCENCHVGAGSSISTLPVVDGAKFTNSRMSHAGITTCGACHGPAVAGFVGVTKIIVMPPTSPAGAAAHIPSSTACESCHLATMPSGLIAANAVATAPGTLFATPSPSTSQIHAGITAGCTSCHEGGTSWMGMAQYPITPSTLSASATTQYLGFNTRPGPAAGTFQIADGAHPTAGDCAQCHANTNYFEGNIKPSNHIPTASGAQCSDCHKSQDFSVIPAITDIHAHAPSSTTGCDRCHGSAAASFAIPAANFSIVGLPSGHVPTTASCETCHVGAGSSIAATPVVNGAKFTNSAMSHSGLTTCVTCHGPTVTGFTGITKIVVMPPTSPAGPSSHIPSTTACESCHLAAMPAGLVPGNATATAPGTKFATPAPSTAQIHMGVTGGCATCHEHGTSWMGIGQYPLSPAALTGVPTTQYFGFNTRPGATAGANTLVDAGHPTSGDCSQCHGNTNYFEGMLKPSNHIPTASTALCTDCHKGTDFSVIPTLTDIHAHAPSTSASCDRCHGNAAASFAIPAASFSIVGLPSNHVPTTGSCETCHVGASSSIAATPVVNGAKFANSAMNHAGLTTCATCHAPTVTGFAGITKITVMPPTSPAGASAHIPTSTACETCHLATMPSGLVAANAAVSAPGTKFATPAPSTAQIHAGVTSGCSNCHESGSVWLDVSQYPISPTALTGNATTQYIGFNTRPGKAASTFSLADNAHPTSGDCGQCHGNTNYFERVLKPANHIPTAASATCSSCHTSTDFSVLPSLTAIHANAPSTTTGCDQCHGSAAASFAIPAANFSIVGLPSNHVPTTASCETCHVGAGSSITATPVVNGAKFSNSAMNHAGLTTCVTCHGPTVTGFAGITKIIVMPPTSPAGPSAHIPSATACESCHQASMPSGLVPANAATTAPGTKFQTPAPSTAQIHSGITSGCAACHETGLSWMGAGQYPIAPTALTGNPSTQYLGFNTRPGTTAGTFALLDAAHPTSGDCSQCHGSTNYFDGAIKPANHIPTAATATCANCHTSTDFPVLPTLTAIHAYAPSTSANCNQCHGSAAASFAIPAANFSIVGLPSNHVPTTGSCETCHVGAGSSIAATPVVNGAKFANSAMSHSGITTCVTCHGPTVTGFAGITKITVMPPTSPAGPSAHIPSGTSCESCHLAAMPSGLVAANAAVTAPGTKFATPAPSTAQIHAGVTTGCASCHEGGTVWMGAAQYPIVPAALSGVTTTQYTGFQTRPGPVASTYVVADGAHPTSGDCGTCHGNTNYFDGVLKPANHIPTAATATCTNCHTGTDFSVMPTLTAIHAYAPSTTGGCDQCHGSAAASFAIPAANFSIVGLPSNHVPTSSSCETCHVGAGSSIAATPVVNGAKFANSAMNHAGVTTCAGCHGWTVSGSTFVGITKIVVMPPTSPAGPGAHIPTSTACETCHTAAVPAGLIAANATMSPPGTKFATPAPSTAQIHGGMTSGCTACHEAGDVWMGMGSYPISPAALSANTGTQYLGFNTRPGVAAGTFAIADSAHPTSGDCAQCHAGTDYFAGNVKPANHIPTAATAQCTDCHKSTDFSVIPAITDIHAHAPSTTAACDTCHGSAAASFAIPAANFSIVGLPTNHVPTTASCETCHVGAGSSIAATPVVNGAKFSNSAMNHSGLTTCVTCHGPTVTGFAGITKITVMPPTSPAGPAAHIPSGTACEACHQAAMPSGLVAANAAVTAPGTKFATPAPSTAQIHAGITSGCTGCHEGGTVWMGAGQYPISPTALTGISTTQYLGFQTRPGPAAGTYVIADGAHPTSGDCSQCHGNTNYFDGAIKPSNHIPTAATATCANCHTSADFSVSPTLTAIHAYAPSTSASCDQCHGSAAASFAIPAANFSIVGLPSNHVPTTASCETCHVGAGSSIAATPVVTGAKFSNSAMSHSGLTTCVTCHGPTVTGFAGITKIVVMPPTAPAGANSHVPTGTACESCHLGSMPAGLVPANATLSAPGTKFATPAPSTAQIHAGVTTGCANCHDSGSVWTGVNQYPIAPTALTGVATTQYTGFNTRPGASAGTYALLDVAHPTSGDCSQCHGNTNYFEGVLKPANHIPTAATAVCTNCHVATDFAVMPSLTAIHAYAPGTSSGCDQCHGSAAASFAIPAANFSIVGLPSNHVPTTASCETCHVGAGSSIAATPVVNGAKFANSAMNHSGLTTCVSCHGPTVTGFAGITKLVVLPPTSPSGPTAHIPSGTACESCHQASVPSGLIAANATATAPGTRFMTPAPTTSQIHAGVTSGCTNCHESGSVWMDAGQYPIAPTALTGDPTTQYIGFNTRPGKAASAFALADNAHPTSGDCGQCHANTNYFEGVLKPANHIPTAASATCTSCHTGTDFSVAPTLTAIHANAPSTSANCDQCHGSAAGSFAIPAANFAIVGLPSNHVPTTASCEACHVGAGSSIAATPVVNGAKFANSAMSHVGLTTCVACHGPGVAGFAGITKITVMPSTSPAGPGAHIPSSTVCESCHAASMPSAFVPANAPVKPPGTGFATPVPTTAQIHAGVTSGCTACHESGATWIDMSRYPISPTALTGVATTQYVGFNTRPGKTASTFNVADPAHPTSGDCAACHGNTNYFEGVLKPANHIPTAPAANCGSCHTSTDFAILPTLTAIHANAPSTTTNCSQCHGSAAASFAIPAANFSIVGQPSNHIPTGSTSCETCHVGAGSSIGALPVTNGASFANATMNHAGQTTCVGCHGPAAGSFDGIKKIIVMPPTSPAGAASHIPSGLACETCHLASMPAAPVPASATAAVPGSKFATPAPTTAQIHAGVTSGCTSCHETGSVWVDMNRYPLSPTALTGVATTQYTGFNTRPGAAAGTYTLLDVAHPTTGDCAQCHGNTSYFEGMLKPANHIPTATSATCTNCHVGTDFAVMPTLSAIHAYAPSTTTNCAQCHGSAAASFAIPAANFSIVGLPANHVPTAASCETCHVGAGSSIAATPVVNGAKFSNSAMNHSGITTCLACHGPTVTGFAGITKIIVMPPTSPAGASAHIPSGTACESCHLATMPSGLVAANAATTAPGTRFMTPAPSTAQIHSGVTSGCTTCHEGGSLWMGMSQYPLVPTALTGNASTQYLGFDTRPGKTAGTFALLDPAHPSSGDCSQCHGNTNYFEGALKPQNHIPTATSATCANCHVGTDFSVSPTLTAIHAYAPSTSANCSQCHGSAAASFAMPAANFSIVGLPANHVPTTASCETCHVGAGSSIAATPVANGAKFSNSAMSHAGLTTCVTCHGPTVTGFAGITRIVVMPPTSPASASAHIPSGTACESCHLAAMPSGLVAANATATAPGTRFMTPAPSTTQIHAGITGGCATCHEGGLVWMGATQYPQTPATVSGSATTQYLGFNTRPGAAASAFRLADAQHPSSGDCSMCHTGFSYFDGQAEPAGHIPTTSSVCSTCHTTAGNYAVYTTNLTQLHSAVATTCSTCHADGKGPFTGATGFKIVQMSTRGAHVPITNKGLAVECSGCHTNVTAFSGTVMSHAAIGDSGSSAAGNACDSCHEYGMRSKWYGLSTWQRDSASHYYCAPGGTTICPNGGADCTTGCHQHSISSAFAIGKKQRAPTVAPKPGSDVPGRSGPTIAPAPGLGGGMREPPVRGGGFGDLADAGGPAGGRFDHTRVQAACFSCHNGTRAAGKPAAHLLAPNDCDRCHTTSAWKPAAFDHAASLAGTCATCHNGLTAAAKPGNHPATQLSCDNCHYALGWSPQKPKVVAPPPKPPVPVPRVPADPRRRPTVPLTPTPN